MPAIRFRPIGRQLPARLLGVLIGLLMITGLDNKAVAQTAQYNLIIQPFLSPAQTRESFQPLADYLARVTNAEIKLVVSQNFVAYWEQMKRGDKFDIVLDAPYFTDYRIQNMDYEVLAKVKGTISLALVTHEDTFVLDPEELVGKTVAVLPSPSLPGIRLNEFFQNPVRQPYLRAANDSNHAIEMVLSKKAVATIVPTPIVEQYPSLNTVLYTDPLPHTAVSVSPSVPQPVRDAIKRALVDAEKTDVGQRMLRAINVPSGFEPATPQVYDGMAALLEGVWGY